MSNYCPHGERGGCEKCAQIEIASNLAILTDQVLTTEDDGTVLGFATSQNGWSGVAFVRYGKRVKMVQLEDLGLVGD